jgi:hypothetical protein
MTIIEIQGFDGRVEYANFDRFLAGLVAVAGDHGLPVLEGGQTNEGNLSKLQAEIGL